MAVVEFTSNTPSRRQFMMRVLDSISFPQVSLAPGDIVFFNAHEKPTPGKIVLVGNFDLEIYNGQTDVQGVAFQVEREV